MPNTLTAIFHAAKGSRKEAICEPLRPFLLVNKPYGYRESPRAGARGRVLLADVLVVRLDLALALCGRRQSS
jgi:hypothetical protein